MVTNLCAAQLINHFLTARLNPKFTAAVYSWMALTLTRLEVRRTIHLGIKALNPAVCPLLDARGDHLN